MKHRSLGLLLSIAASLAAGCSIPKPSATQSTKQGVAGQYWFVNLFSPPMGGVITSDVGGIDCGASSFTVSGANPPQYVYAYYASGAGQSNRCGQNQFPWSQAVVLTATPRDGNAFYGWAGDCGGTGTCTLSAGADKTVVAIFGPPGGGHANLLDPALHGPAYLAFRTGAQAPLQCTACHGATLGGLGIAPSCNDCHAKAGFPDWQNDCSFCHTSPPAAPHAQRDDCGTCHAGYAKTSARTGTVNPATHLNGRIDVNGAGCTACHGTSGVNPAPPFDTAGRSATTLVSVGAHQAHVAATLSAPLACTECHGAAAATYSAAHSDGTVQVGFGPLANQGTSTVWNGASCAASYCHGGTTALTGGATTAPVWTLVDGSQKGCASCHGFPPPAPHAQNDACGSCHTGYSKTGPTTGTVNAATHVNGRVDVVGITCTSCHGTSGVNAAPPADTAGRTATTLVSVGAHQAHVAATLSAPLACTECHGAAAASYGIGHSDGTVQVGGALFGPLANRGTSTVWNGASCAASYCHGGTAALAGGSATTPAWTLVDGSQKGCASCHGSPPPAPHLQRDDCGTCHAGYSKTGPTTGTVNAATHVNGTVEVRTLTCTSCHGDALRSADPTLAAMPPLGTHGETLPTQRGVGAHAAHLAAGPLASAFACTDCHNPPTSTSHATGAVLFSWSPLARGGGTPAFNPTDASCASTYCHGNFTNGNTTNAPIWTAAGTGASCGSCHGLPPGGTHTSSTACASCHGPGYSLTTVNPATHVDGVVTLASLTCTSCHGTVGVNPAPPVDTAGLSATTLVSVGAHQAHVAATLSAPLACTECHGAAAASYGTGHSDGTVQVGGALFGPLANRGTSTVWNGASCAASYCHGGTAALAGGSATTPAWTLVDGSQKGCASCHGSPPPAPHAQRDDCGTCHPGYAKTGPTTGTVVAATHVNGTVEVVGLSCTSCHGTAGVNPAPPADTHGNTASTGRGVGAHQAHVAATLSAPIACTQCHGAASASYGTGHADGTIQVGGAFFGALANQGTTATWNGTSCAASYCHGGSSALSGGTATAPVWTLVDGSQKGCTSCHGSPPPAPHMQRDDCGTCHAGYSKTGPTTGTVNAATHVNGTVEVAALSCTTCHGDANLGAVAGADANVKAAPPVDTHGNGATTARGVGVHQAHVNGTRSRPVACSECHGSLAGYTASHSDGATPIAFGGLGSASGAAFSTTTLGCAATYCHGNFSGGNGAAATPAWTSAGTLGCTACHGNPPPAPHVQRDDCGTCHPGYAKTGAATGTVAAATHVDGKVDLDPNLSCSTCHTTYAMAGTATYHHVMGSDALPTAPYPTNNSPATTALADKNCLECHVAHDLFGAPGQVMRSSITGPVTAAATDAALCTSCHANDQQKDQARQKSDGTTATAGWAASAAAGWSAATNAGGHNYTVPGAFQASSAAAGAFTVNCVKCHNSSEATAYQTGTATFSLHESADRRLRGPLGQATAGDNNEQGFCFRCHSATTDAVGGTVKGSTALDWYGAQAMPAKATGLFAQVGKLATGSGHNTGGYAGLHRPNPAEENLAYLAANKHVECSDCHDPHQSRRGNQSVTGTATSVAATSLGDTTAAWIPGQWVGYSVDVATTTAATTWVRGQITANTATGLTFSTLSTTPSGLVPYRIGVRLNGGVVSAATATTLTDSQTAVGGAKAWATNAWAGWTVNIVLGVGAGQSFPIASNTATALTIAGSWATTPTTTSRYVISRLPNVMAGASGVNVTAWGTASPAWGAANTLAPSAGSTTPLPVAATQWQVCFKCHSAANASLATWKSTWTNLAQDFNPNNQSYHPVVAPAAVASGTGVGNTQLTAAQLANGWKPGDVMTCSDCHGNDDTTAAASQGPHASAVAFILRGTNLRWPFQANGTTRWTVSNSTTGVGTAAGLFCRNCHPALTGVHTAQSSHQSQACVACHLVIPHGGKVKRLIRTTNTPAPYVDAGVTAALRAYSGGTSSSACGASCTSSHSLTATTTNSW